MRLTYPTTRARKLSPGAPLILRLKTDARRSGEPAPDAGLLGDVSNDKQRALAQLAGRIRQPGFTLHLDDAGQWLRSRVVWLGMRHPPRGLLQLANMLRAQAARSGCYQSPQPFHPHITLLRDASHTVAIPPPGFAGHFRSRRLRFTPLRMGKAVPAMPSCSAGRWANNNEGMSMLFSPFTTRYADSAL